MITLEDFRKIKDLREEGFNRNQIANRLEISHQTVAIYWDMSEEDYRERYRRVHEKGRRSKIAKFEEEVLNELRYSPEVSASHIHKMLKARHPDETDFSERTTRNFVRRIREYYGIKKLGKEKESE